MLSVLVTVHVVAALFYLVVKRDNLIAPMITGRKQIPDHVPVTHPHTRLWFAALLLALSGLGVWFLVNQ